MSSQRCVLCKSLVSAAPLNSLNARSQSPAPDTRIVRLGVSVATSGDFSDHPRVADAASELLRDIFGKDKSPCRLVYGVASLPLGTPVELEVIFEVAGKEGREFLLHNNLIQEEIK
jgi:hypothetical protein